MIRILYFSTARSTVGAEEVSEIVKHATERNAERGITGALAFNGRNFCQVLEGEEDQVMSLLEVIEADPRHAGFKVLDQKEISTRYFPDWTMRLVDQLDFSKVINAMRA